MKKSKLILVLIIISVVMFISCNLERDRVLLMNNTTYTVGFEYRAGTNGDGSDDFQTVEIEPDSQRELYDVEFWMGDSEMELMTHGCWAVDADVDIDMDTISGNYLWPLTIIFSVDE